MAAAYAAGAANLPFGVLRGYARHRPAPPTRASRAIDVPVHRRGARRRAGAPARTSASSTPSGRPARQRAALGDRRRAEGGRARLGALDRHGRGDRRRARAAAGRDRPAGLGDRRGRARARAARTRRTPTATTSATTTSTSRWDAISRDRDAFTRVDARSTCSRRRDESRPRGRRRERATRADEMMAVEAARRLRDGTSASSGSGCRASPRTSRGATHAPGCVLVYESGTIGAKPGELPLSIGDGELAETADAVVSVPEMFAYWLQGGRIDVGFLGAAQIDRLRQPEQHGDRRLRRARRCGCPAAAARPRSRPPCARSFVMLRQSPRTFVERLDFRTSGRRRGVAASSSPTSASSSRTRDRRADADVSVHPGVSADAGARGDGLGAPGRRRPRARRAPPTRARARRRCARCKTKGEWSA